MLPIDAALTEIRQRYAGGTAPLPDRVVDGAVLLAFARPSPTGVQAGCVWAPDERTAGLVSAQAMRQGMAVGTALRLRVDAATGRVTREEPTNDERTPGSGPGDGARILTDNAAARA